jgi:hypothetical protein
VLVAEKKGIGSTGSLNVTYCGNLVHFVQKVRRSYVKASQRFYQSFLAVQQMHLISLDVTHVAVLLWDSG